MARIKCFFISIIYLLLVIGLCGCNPKDGLQERLCITLVENEELMVHPFLTENGDAYAVVLPAHWSINKLIARYTSSGCFQIGETQIHSNWSPLHVELQKPYELTDGMQITFYQVASKSVFINTKSGSMEQIDSSEDQSYGESGRIVITSDEGQELFRNEIKEIVGHGNGTWDSDKKSYNIVFENKQKMLDLEKDKEFCLLSHNPVNNYICYNIAEEMKNFYPIHGDLVNVYLNGHYNGLYFLCNRVKIGKNLVDIPDMEEINKTMNPEAFKDPVKGALKNSKGVIIVKGFMNLSEPEDITGGYVIERTQYKKKFNKAQSAFIDTLGNYYRFRTQKRLSVRQVNYMRDLVNQTLVAIMAEDGVNPTTGKHYSQYIHTESFVRYYLTQELLCNYDAGMGSFYMVKNTDANESRLVAAPIWDMDWTLGSMHLFPLNRVPNSLVVSAGFWTPRYGILSYLMKHHEFSAMADSLYYSEMVPIMNKWFVNDGLKEDIKHDARFEYLKNPLHIYAPFDEVWSHFRQFEKEKLRTYDLFAQNRVKKTAAEVVLNFGWRDNSIVMLQPLGENIYIPELPYWRDDKSNPHVSQGWFVNGDQPIDPANYKVESDVYVEQHWYQAKPTFFKRVCRRLGFNNSK